MKKGGNDGVGGAMIELLRAIGEDPDMSYANTSVTGAKGRHEGSSTDLEVASPKFPLPEMGDPSGEVMDAPPETYTAVEGDSIGSVNAGMGKDKRTPAPQGDEVDSDAMRGWKPSKWSGIKLPEGWND